MSTTITSPCQCHSCRQSANSPRSSGCQCGSCQAARSLIQQANGMDGVVNEVGGQVSRDAAGLRSKIVEIALREWKRWELGRRTELEPQMSSTLIGYWQAAGVMVTAAQMTSRAFQSSHPWSAAFISYVMRQAGSGAAFRYAAAHSYYIAAAKNNRLQNNSNPFKLYRFSETRLRPGDIICKARDGSGANFDSIRPGMKTHCDIVVDVSPGRVLAIGGNVNNTVGRKTLEMLPDGSVKGYFAVIKVGTLNQSSNPPLPPVVPPTPSSATVGRTIYAPIDLGITSGGARVRPQTGIYCPPNFRPSSRVDIVIYLHGIRNPRTTIDTYWDARRNPHFALREEFAKSRRNAILVAPLLGSRSQNEIGSLARSGGLDQYIRQVLAVMAAQQLIPQGAMPGRIILACHSGGGHAMRLIVSAQNSLTSAIGECWGFDCTYGVNIRPDDATFWANWTQQNANRRLFVYYLGSTAAQSEKLRRMGIRNVTVERSRGRNHNWVPHAHLLERLVNSPNLQPS